MSELGGAESSTTGDGRGSPGDGRVFYILTGLSGAGKSQVSHYLEDQGFYCADNVPPELIEKFVELTLQTSKNIRQVLLVCDIRSTDQFQTLLEELDRLDRKGIHHVILFLEASTETLIRRFSETRRRHPLNSGSMREDIETERHLLEVIRAKADIIVDTTSFTAPQLRRHILKVLKQKPSPNHLNLMLTSFGFKFGIPLEADLVFDVRFLPNPHYVPELAPLTGCDSGVDDFIFGTEVARSFLKHLSDFLEFLVPQYVLEGKTNLTIAVGCTGGQHRSVAVIERLTKVFEGQKLSVLKTHRELERREAAR